MQLMVYKIPDIIERKAYFLFEADGVIIQLCTSMHKFQINFFITQHKNTIAMPGKTISGIFHAHFARELDIYLY